MNSKKIGVIFFFLFFFAFMSSAIFAQGVFECSCRTSESGSCLPEVTSNNCASGYTSSASLCTADAGCISGSDQCYVECIAEQQVTTANPGDSCGSGSPDPNISCLSGSFCRRGFDNNFYCLGQDGVLADGDTCSDSTECFDHENGAGCIADAVGQLGRCRMAPRACAYREACEYDEGRYVCDYLDACAGITDEEIEEQENRENERQDSENIPKFEFCNQIPEGPTKSACIDCYAEATGGKGGKLFTAVGCIDTDQNLLAADLIRLMLGVGGGIGLLSILAAAFIFTTSQGDTSKVKQAKELMTAAVSGLLFIIFSIIILDFIGVRILMIPGLG